MIEAPFFDALLGKRASHVWRGHGSAIFVEFGKLVAGESKDETTIQQTGELTLMIEWTWRIERPKSILGGSWTSERKWQGIFKKLIGATVSNVQLYGQLPEIYVSLSNGLRIASFMTAEGQPQWALISRKPNVGSLFVKRGVLYVQSPAS